MRTTLRIDDALLRELKDKASEEDTSMTRLIDRILRAGLRAEQHEKRRSGQYREDTFSMGRPSIDLTKALAVSSALEDDEILRKDRLRK
jgi:hypothetical protein